mgnify:FL=1
MVTRYPHTALITYEIGGKLVNGEWVDGETKTLSVKGRYDSVSDGRIVMKKNSLGDEKQVHGYFYTKVRPDIDVKYLRLQVPSLNVDVDIICWESYQSHSIINV